MKVMIPIMLVLLSACADDTGFYQQVSIIETPTQFCSYLGAELIECTKKEAL